MMEQRQRSPSPGFQNITHKLNVLGPQQGRPPRDVQNFHKAVSDGRVRDSISDAPDVQDGIRASRIRFTQQSISPNYTDPYLTMGLDPSKKTLRKRGRSKSLSQGMEQQRPTTRIERSNSFSATPKRYYVEKRRGIMGDMLRYLNPMSVLTDGFGGPHLTVFRNEDEPDTFSTMDHRRATAAMITGRNTSVGVSITSASNLPSVEWSKYTTETRGEVMQIREPKRYAEGVVAKMIARKQGISKLIKPKPSGYINYRKSAKELFKRVGLRGEKHQLAEKATEDRVLGSLSPITGMDDDLLENTHHALRHMVHRSRMQQDLIDKVASSNGGLLKPEQIEQKRRAHDRLSEYQGRLDTFEQLHASRLNSLQRSREQEIHGKTMAPNNSLSSLPNNRFGFLSLSSHRPLPRYRSASITWHDRVRGIEQR